MVGEILEFKISQKSSLGGKKVYDALSGHAHGLPGCMKRLWRKSGTGGQCWLSSPSLLRSLVAMARGAVGREPVSQALQSSGSARAAISVGEGTSQEDALLSEGSGAIGQKKR